MTTLEESVREQVADWLIHNLFWGVAWGRQHEAADELLKLPALRALLNSKDDK